MIASRGTIETILMKRYRRYIWPFIAFLLLLTVSCQNSEVFEHAEEEATQLWFNATLGAAQTATRASESDNNMLKKASAAGTNLPHMVIHTYTGTPGSSLKPYFSDELGYFTSGDYWDVNSGKARFLPQGGMNLYAYFATDIVDKGSLTGIDYLPPATATDHPKLTYTVDNSDALHQLDLIAAKVENITQPDVSIPFRHILSQVNFGVKGIDRHQIMIKNIRINNLYGKGTFNYESWSWTPDNNVVHSYPYYFPDRKEQVLGSGSGQYYRTQGTNNDSQNTYIFGDGGKFGPGDGNTILYAQTESTTNDYATKANTKETLHNSLMLLPQEIKANPDATVTFDYEITINGQTIRSGTDCHVRLDSYHDWRPNLRYVYVFNFDDPSDKITFDLLINEWQNWDGPNGNGLKNGTIQEPTRSTLNTIGDDETIYLLGLLERNLTWDWSDGTQYTFDHLNTLTLDFSGVETNGFSVNIIVPEGFTLQTDERKQILTRNNKRLLEPTEKQLNERKNGSTFTLYGTVESDLVWNWSDIAFASLKKNELFTLNFTHVTFDTEKSIKLTLPKDVIASGTSVVGNNPYTINSTAANVTITNLRVDTVQEPSKQILNVVSDHTEIKVNGGNVRSTGDTWNWSAFTFPNLDPQESFNLVFTGVTFDERSIQISLPAGFRAYTNTSETSISNKLNLYQVKENGTIIVKNNKINYPTSSQIDALSNGSIITLSGEKLPSDAALDWSGFSFPNLLPQATFTLDVNGIDFFSNLTLKVPSHFVLPEWVPMSDSNTYTLSSKSRIVIRNDKIQKPSDSQLNFAINGSVITMTGGKLYTNETWDWQTISFASLGGPGKSFTIEFSDANFNSKTIELRLPNGFTASGRNVTFVSFGVYTISDTDSITITDSRRSVTNGKPMLNDVVHGSRLVLVGSLSKLQEWTWSDLPLLNTGEWFEIDYSQTNVNGQYYFYINHNAGGESNNPYSVSGAVKYDWAILLFQPNLNNGIVRFTKK